ncbi:unnamed protein product [Scytosiphon promiscuus]
MSGRSGDSWSPQSTNEHIEAESTEPHRRLTFVSHAGEDKSFARSLLDAIEAANVATFFDDDMAMGTPAGDEITSRAATADLAVVVVSRPFLTKKWPMLELNLFLKNRIRIHPLYYGVSPDEVQDIIGTYDRQAGDDEPAFRLRMKENPGEWQILMEEIAASTRDGSSSLPDPMWWREDLRKFIEVTGLRRENFREDKGDERDFVTAVAKVVAPPVLPGIVPPLPDHFVNVPLVDSLVSELLGCTTNNVVRGTALTGMGGAGKSVIASAVVRDKRIRRHFTDGVLWLDQEPGEYNEDIFLLELKKLAQQFEEVVLSRHYRQGRDVQYNMGDLTSVSRAQGLFQMWQKKYGLRCLLVVDNTWNVQILEAVSLMGFQILATTRKGASIPASPGWRLYAVPRMDKDTSLRVLQSCSGAPCAVPREPALEVADACAFLPLALAVIGSTLRGAGNPGFPDAWRQLQRKLKGMEETNHDEGEWGSLNNVLAVSIDELGRTRRNLFLMLAVLGKGVPAPIEMLRNLWGEEDLEGARFFVEGLVTRSLLQRRAADRYFVHDLLLDFAKVTINAKTKKCEAIRVAATSRQTQYLGSLGVLRGYSVDGDSLEGLYSMIGLWRSLEHLTGDEQLEVRTYKASLIKLGEEDESTDVASVYSDLGLLYELQAKFTEAEPLLEKSQAIIEKALGPDHSEMAASLNNRAGLLESQGKYAEAEPLYERCQAIEEKLLGPDHPNLATTLNNRALLFSAQGKYAEAEPLYERCQAMEEKRLGPDHPDLATLLNNRAELLRAQGKYAGTELLYERSQAIYEKSLGPEHPHVATALNNRAESLREQGNFAEAGRLYERCQAIYEKAFGSKHPHVATALNNWAELLRQKGKYAEAEPLYERCQAIEEKVLGPHHPSLATTLNNRALLLSAQGKYDEAGPLLERSLAIREKALGPDHRLVAESLNNWAELLESQGKYDDAEPLYVRSIAIGEKTLGPEHPDLVVSLNNRAELLRAQGKYEEVEPLYERCQAIEEKALGPEHPSLASTLNNRAGFMESQGKYQEAGALYERSLAIGEKALGPDHPDVATLLNNRAEVLRAQVRAKQCFKKHLKENVSPQLYSYIRPARRYDFDTLSTAFQGKYEEAEPLYERSQAIREKVLGPEHPDVAESLNNRALLLDEQGKYVEAEPLYERCQAIEEKVLGPEHPSLATTLNNRAALLEIQGKYNEAGPLYERCQAIYEKVFGPDHPSLATALNNRALLLKAQGIYEEAEPLFDRALSIREKALQPDHPHVAQSLNNRALLFEAQGEYDDAEPLYARAIAIGEKVLGSEHPDLARWLNNRAGLLGKQVRTTSIRLPDGIGRVNLIFVAQRPRTHYSLLAIQGKFKEADSLYLRAIEIGENTLGPDHPDLAAWLKNRADLLKAQDKHTEAIPLLERALAIRIIKIGENHPDTISTQNSLEFLRKKVYAECTEVESPDGEASCTTTNERIRH